MKKLLSLITVMSVIIGAGMTAQAASSGNDIADLVVYGKIFTSEGNQIAEAFAVKNGKYVYVGDKKGAEAFIDKDKTEVVDHTGKGLVMPSCGNGHSHYMLGYALKTIGTTIGLEDDPNKFLTEIVPVAVKKARVIL